MKDIEKQAVLFHAESKQFKSKLSQARSILNRAFSITNKWYVALSGGKDSTVVFDLAQQKYKNQQKEKSIPSIWSDDEFFLPETFEYIQRLILQKKNIYQIQTNTKHTEWFSSNKNSDILSIQEYTKAKGFDGGFLGLRAEENRYRKNYLSRFGLLNYVRKDKLFQCNPIGWWTYMDVWAYIVSKNIDYNKAYDKLSDLGLPLNKQRIGPFATEKALGYGQLAILKMGWPEQYQKFVEKYPQAKAYC